MKLRSSSIKTNIMKNLKKLKEFADGNVAISNDLTKLQRETHKKLILEAKDLNSRNTNTNVYHKVVGPPGKEFIKIVQKN